MKQHKSVKRNNQAFHLPMIEPSVQGKNSIPVAKPDISVKEKSYLFAAFHSSWISSAGSFVSRFEDAFAKTVSHTRFAIAVNSGTSALHIGLRCLGIRPGDEVIVPTFTMIASANAVRYCGAIPVFVDADPSSWNIDISHIESRITRKTRAIMVVHVYGVPADMGPVYRLAKRYNLKVIEDAAEAHGALYRNKHVGSIGDIAGFSLYANKIITTGEGGMVTTNNASYAALARRLRNHAFGQGRHFWHSEVGHSYNMNNLSAALGLAQVERFGQIKKKRNAHVDYYRSRLAQVPGLVFQQIPDGTHAAPWVFGLRVDPKKYGMTRDQLRTYLAKKGIETRSFFTPIHRQPAYEGSATGIFPVADALSQDGLYVSCASVLTTAQRATIARAIISGYSE